MFKIELKFSHGTDITILQFHLILTFELIKCFHETTHRIGQYGLLCIRIYTAIGLPLPDSPNGGVI